jgi:hypothetical protein
VSLGDATLSQWAAALLPRIGAPVTANNQANMGAWYECEQSDADYNIWNTTLACCGGSPVNSAGVMSYPSLAAGVDATVSTLLGGNFGPIVAVFRSDGTRLELANAVGATGWGTSPACIDSAASPPGGTKGGGGPVTVSSASDWSPQIREAAKRCGRCAARQMAGAAVTVALTAKLVPPVVTVPAAKSVLWVPGTPLPTLPEET